MAKVLSGIGFSIDLYTFTDEDFARVEKALEVESLNDNQRQRLQKICELFCMLSESWKLAPRPKEARHWLKKVHADAQKLDETLLALHEENVPDRSARDAAIEFLRSMAPPGTDWGVTLFDLIKLERRVRALSNTARKAQDCLLKDKGGNSGDMPLEDLVEKLATFFTKVTGEGPSISYDPCGVQEQEYHGHFFNLVESFLAPLGDYQYRQRNHQGLGKFIMRTLPQLHSKDTTASENKQ